MSFCPLTQRSTLMAKRPFTRLLAAHTGCLPSGSALSWRPASQMD